jgi:hypothetical protein
MAHSKPIGVALDAELIDYIDRIRGVYTRSLLIREIIKHYRKEKGLCCPTFDETKRKAYRHYGSELIDGQTAIRAFETSLQLVQWVADDPNNRAQMAVRDRPTWATMEYLHSLPIHDPT